MSVSAASMGRSFINGWIFCGGMMRAGSTLQYQIASELIERSNLGQRTTWVPACAHEQVLSRLPPTGISTFKAHQLSPQIAAHCYTGSGIALYIFRDLRDVISSYQQKEARRISGSELAGLVVMLLEEDARWRALPDVQISRYEDVIADIAYEIAKTAKFLKCPIDERDCSELASVLSYGAQERRIKSSNPENLVRLSETIAFDAKTLLHRNHLQGGSVGRYKTNMDKDQCAHIEQMANDWLASNGYLALSAVN